MSNLSRSISFNFNQTKDLIVIAAHTPSGSTLNELQYCQWWRDSSFNWIIYTDKKWYCSQCCCGTSHLGAHIPCIAQYKRVIDTVNNCCRETGLCHFGCCILDWDTFINEC